MVSIASECMLMNAHSIISHNIGSGSWMSRDNWVVVEKPRGLFEDTLYLSARLEPPREKNAKAKLVQGAVHVEELVAGEDPSNPDPKCAPLLELVLIHLGGSLEQAVICGNTDLDRVNLKKLGKFGAISYSDITS